MRLQNWISARRRELVAAYLTNGTEVSPRLNRSHSLRRLLLLFSLALFLTSLSDRSLAACTGSCTTMTVGDDVVHTFTANGTFTPPTGVNDVQYLVVGGGGGGGAWRGGGGGGGGYLEGNLAVVPNVALNVSVGAGGAGAPGGAWRRQPKSWR